MKNPIAAVITLFMTFSLVGQENLNAFKINFYNNNGAIAISCVNGCTWKEMAINKNKFYLNQNGMVNYETNSEATNNSNFIIYVHKKRNKIHLKSIKGTNWKNITFKLAKNTNKYISVDQNQTQEL